MADEEVDAWELMRRQQKVQGVDAALSAVLGMVEEHAATDLPPPPAPKSKAPRSHKRAAPPPRKATEPLRKSARHTAAGMDPEVSERLRAEQEERVAEEIAEIKRKKHAPRPIEVVQSVTGSGYVKALKFVLANITSEPKPEPKVEDQPEAEEISTPSRPSRRASPKKAAATPKVETSTLDEDALTEELKGVSLKCVTRIVPERLYSVAVHPSETTDIAFFGDKAGYIGILHAEMEDDGSFDPQHWIYKAHSGTVSSLRFPPAGTAGSRSVLYSGSYDCTLRKHDLTTFQSEEVLDLDLFDPNEPLLHSFDFTPTGQEIWASDNEGGMSHRDLREPMQAAKRWKVDRYKVGGISVNPANPYLVATSHLKRFVKLWDVRQLQGAPPDSAPEDLDQFALAEYETAKAATSAYFDQSGSKLLVTSYDDYIRVFDINPTSKLTKSSFSPLTPQTEFYHSCQTGRYVSVFKAQWAHNHSDYLTIGNMSQYLDVISAASGKTLASLRGDDVTSVPAITGPRFQVGEKKTVC